MITTPTQFQNWMSESRIRFAAPLKASSNFKANSISFHVRSTLLLYPLKMFVKTSVGQKSTSSANLFGSFSIKLKGTTLTAIHLFSDALITLHWIHSHKNYNTRRSKINAFEPCGVMLLAAQPC